MNRMTNNDDILNEINNSLKYKLYEMTFEKSFSFLSSYCCDILSYNSFLIKNINLNISIEDINNLKTRCLFLKASMLIDDWLYIDNQGLSYTYLNILCEYALKHNIRDLSIPDFIDVLIINSDSKINFPYTIIFNENLSAITSKPEVEGSDDTIQVYKNNIIFHTLIFQGDSEVCSYIDTMDFRNCKNFTVLRDCSLLNININNLLFGDSLARICEYGFNKQVKNLEISSVNYIYPAILDLVENVSKKRYAVLDNKNILNVVSTSKYITNKIICYNESLFILRNNPMISYKNFNTIYLPIHIISFIYTLVDEKELAEGYIHLDNALLFNMFSIIYFYRNMLEKNKIYKYLFLQAIRLINYSSYDYDKTFNIIFYNASMNNNAIIDRNYILSRVYKRTLCNHKYIFTISLEDSLLGDTGNDG